jgi:arginase family enzyme
MHDLHHFLAEKHLIETQEAKTYNPHQWGACVQVATGQTVDWDAVDMVILGCGERRGQEEGLDYSQAPDAIRKHFYQSYNWHPSLKIADMGNIRAGASVGDTRAALRTVLHELQQAGKVVILLGGSHDLAMQQYEAFKKSQQIIHAASADMLIDFADSEQRTDRSFLLEMLTEEPIYVAHYSHIGFQSYLVPPRILEALDKLRFDFYRLGKVRERMEEMEPVLRSSHLFSFDLNTVRYSDAPANRAGSPNGLTGDEACMLARFAGMSPVLTSFGIFGYDPYQDDYEMTAKLIAQMIWYFIDGYQIRKKEAPLSNREAFIEFHVRFTNNDTVFLKSKHSNRWWMQLPDGAYIPCSYHDYLTACNDEIPERWLRTQERLL